MIPLFLRPLTAVETKFSVFAKNMPHSTDIERGEAEYKEKAYDDELEATEQEALLPSAVDDHISGGKIPAKFCTSYHPRFGPFHLLLAFLGGSVALLVGQFALSSTNCFTRSTSGKVNPQPYVQGPAGSGALGPSALVAPPWVGSSVAHHYPPPSPTNAKLDLFPTDMGYPGATPTGAEPGVIATAPSIPIHSGAPNLLAPPVLKSSKSGFDIFKYWGNLSPWYSIKKGKFGVDSGPEVPGTCRVTALHLLHRHGARYPSGWNPSECDLVRSFNFQVANIPIPRCFWQSSDTRRQSTQVCIDLECNWRTRVLE